MNCYSDYTCNDDFSFTQTYCPAYLIYFWERRNLLNSDHAALGVLLFQFPQALSIDLYGCA